VKQPVLMMSEEHLAAGRLAVKCSIVLAEKTLEHPLIGDFNKAEAREHRQKLYRLLGLFEEIVAGPARKVFEAHDFITLVTAIRIVTQDVGGCKQTFKANNYKALLELRDMVARFQDQKFTLNMGQQRVKRSDD
jgi:hypothetical protein